MTSSADRAVRAHIAALAGTNTDTAPSADPIVNQTLVALDDFADAVSLDGAVVAAAAQGDATQALADAATADGKAVAAQADATQALADAATADGKAVAAQADATTALADAATADGKAVAAQADATTGIADAATADGKAVAAQADATTALAYKTEIQAIVAACADFNEFKTDIAAWTPSP